MKTGIDYFPLDCYTDKNIEIIEAQFGLKGFAIMIKLYQMIYGEKGYYCKWNEETALLFSKRNCNLRAGENIALEVANIAIKRGIFSEEKYKQYGILTSEEIQKTYFEIVKRRTKAEIQKEYLLVSQEQIPQNVYINDKNVCRNAKNVNRKGQSKESKETKENISPFEKGCGNAVEKEKEILSQKYFALFWESYPKKMAKKEAQKAWKQLSVNETLYQEICDAVEKQKQQEEWLKEKGKYVPYPSTWLRGERQKDSTCVEIKTQIPQTPKKDEQLEQWKKMVNGE